MENTPAEKAPRLIPAECERGDAPMIYADSTERAALIAGLRALADYLESNPAVPAPICSTVHTFPLDGGWAEMCAQIDATAALLGVTAVSETYGHYSASLRFGPVEYRTVAIPRRDNESE